MTSQFKLAIVQLNPIVGDIAGNITKIKTAYEQAVAQGADLVITPEMSVLGYPPEDLVRKPALIKAVAEAIEALASVTKAGAGLIVGGPWQAEGGQLHNSVFLLEDGEVAAIRHKHELPNYGTFDEKRLFTPGPLPEPVIWRGIKLGLPICEDIWFECVPKTLAEKGAEIFLVPNASPWRIEKRNIRLEAFDDWQDLKIPFAFCNQIGGQDELVFDGSSFVQNGNGETVAMAASFQEGVLFTHWQKQDGHWQIEPQECGKAPLMEMDEAIYSACVLGLRDYVNKNGFPGVVLGLSGGIDSALTAAMAVDALGSDRVWCVMMPSIYTSKESLADAAGCARALGAELSTIEIKDAVIAAENTLAPHFEGKAADTTEENLQSRLRGLYLMALSNKFGHMVVTTGNKSEMAVGYATLYGDMCGGYNPLKDLYKMQVFALSDWRNKNKPAIGLGPEGEVIPQNIIDKPPSAELREDQKDEDSLPPYEVLDDILHGLIEEEASAEDLKTRGHDEATIRRIEHLLYIAEYKRRQAPPGVKIGPRNFGRDRRYPITNRFRDVKV